MTGLRHRAAQPPAPPLAPRPSARAPCGIASRQGNKEKFAGAPLLPGGRNRNGGRSTLPHAPAAPSVPARAQPMMRLKVVLNALSASWPSESATTETGSFGFSSLSQASSIRHRAHAAWAARRPARGTGGRRSSAACRRSPPVPGSSMGAPGWRGWPGSPRRSAGRTGRRTSRCGPRRRRRVAPAAPAPASGGPCMTRALPGCPRAARASASIRPTTGTSSS